VFEAIIVDLEMRVVCFLYPCWSLGTHWYWFCCRQRFTLGSQWMRELPDKPKEVCVNGLAKRKYRSLCSNTWYVSSFMVLVEVRILVLYASKDVCCTGTASVSRVWKRQRHSSCLVVFAGVYSIFILLLQEHGLCKRVRGLSTLTIWQ
jgi:hypothetical protein